MTNTKILYQGNVTLNKDIDSGRIDLVLEKPIFFSKEIRFRIELFNFNNNYRSFRIKSNNNYPTDSLVKNGKINLLTTSGSILNELIEMEIHGEFQSQLNLYSTFSSTGNYIKPKYVEQKYTFRTNSKLSSIKLYITNKTMNKKIQIKMIEDSTGRLLFDIEKMVQRSDNPQLIKIDFYQAQVFANKSYNILINNENQDFEFLSINGVTDIENELLNSKILWINFDIIKEDRFNFDQIEIIKLNEKFDNINDFIIIKQKGVRKYLGYNLKYPFNIEIYTDINTVKNNLNNNLIWKLTPEGYLNPKNIDKPLVTDNKSSLWISLNLDTEKIPIKLSVKKEEQNNMLLNINQVNGSSDVITRRNFTIPQSDEIYMRKNYLIGRTNEKITVLQIDKEINKLFDLPIDSSKIVISEENNMMIVTNKFGEKTIFNNYLN
jgi:hypothetical protein